MLGSSRSLGTGTEWSGAMPRGPYVFYSSASDVKTFQVCFLYKIVLTEFIHSFLLFFLLAIRGRVSFCDGLMCDKQQPANRSYYANPINKWGWCFKCSFDVANWWLAWRLAFHIKSHGFQWRSQNFSGYCFIDHTNSSGCAGCWMCKLSFFIADPYSANSKCFKPIGSFNNGNCVFRGHSSLLFSSTNTFYDRWCWICRALATKVDLLWPSLSLRSSPASTLT